MKPYYEDGSCTIYHGDCREVLPELDAELTLTDPPYNLGIEYDVHDDSMTADDYAAFTLEWWEACRGKSAIVFPGLSNLSLWCGRISQPLAVGCWYMPGNPGRGFPWSHVEWEPFLVYRTGMLGGSNVYRAPITNQADVGTHPCPKPLTLFAALIARTKAASVVDPFLGSGTTLRAAKDLGVRGIGIELSERYCEIAAKRLAQEVLDFGATA